VSLWLGLVVTSLITSTKLLYIEPDWYWNRWPFARIPSICNQSIRPTQPLTLSGTGIGYRPRSSSRSAAGKVTGVVMAMRHRLWYVRLRAQCPPPTLL